MVVTSPDGEATTFDDGYAFTNGDPADGVELTIDDDELHDDELTLYIDSERRLTVSMSDVVDALTLASPTGRFDRLAEPGDGWVLTSADGSAWSVRAELEDARFGEHPRIVAGEDEVVVVPFAQFETTLQRFPLEPGD